MKQLNTWEPRRSDVIHDFKNQLAWYYDVLYEKHDLIQYSENVTPHKGKAICGMEYEDYIEIKKKDLNGLTYDQILLFLKNTKPEDKIDNFKKFLKSKNIPYEADLWTWNN